MTTRRRTRRRRLTNPALLLAAGIVLIAAAWIIAPLCSEVDTAAKQRWTQPSRAEVVQFRAMGLLIGAWFFFFGASVGSFLNVVVWRLPRGETLIWRPSRCPRCGAGIRALDNIPVFGWLKLRGRCRVCRTPISRRYPIVEFVTGALFLLLAILELFASGVNLPHSTARAYSRLTWFVFDPRAAMVALYAYHCLLVSILLSWSLIDHDRQRVPRGYVAFSLFLGIIAPVVAVFVARVAVGEEVARELPRILHPVPAVREAGAWQASLGWLWLWAEPLAGLVAGAALGELVKRASGIAGRHTPWTAAFALIGVYLGWQAALSTALLTAGLLLAVSWRPKLGETWRLGWLFAALLIQLTFWRQLNDLSCWPGASTPPVLVAVFVCAVAVVAWLAGRMIDSQQQYASVA